jgi:hypothetical protein
MSHNKDAAKSKIYSMILNFVRLNDKSKLAILKVLLDKGEMSRDQLISFIAKSYYSDLPSAWIGKSLDSLIEAGLIIQNEDLKCTLAFSSVIGKLFFEEEEEINRILLQKWGGGDLYYVDPLWQYIARKIFVLGNNVELELLMSELQKDAEDRMGPFQEYASTAEAKYTVIPRELNYMQEFGLISRQGKLLRLPDFVMDFIFQQRTAILKEINDMVTKLRSEKEDINRTLLKFKEIYDLQKLKNTVIHMLSTHVIRGKDELTNHLLNSFEQFQRGNCYDTISSCGRAAEILVAGIFVCLKGEENAKRTPQMGNQLSKLWKTEVPGQITTPLEFVLSLLSSVKWLRDKKGAHSSDLTGFEPPTVDEARHAVASIFLATYYAIKLNLLPR